MKILKRLAVIAGVIAAVPATYAVADFLMTQGAGTTFFDFTCFSTKHCSASAIVNSAGTEIFTGAVPAQVSLANSGAYPLASGASTSALQTSGNSSLTTIATNTTGASTAALQGTGNTSLSTIATNSGTQATAALQTAGNTSLATIATNTAAAVPTVQSGVTTALISCDNHVFKHITTAADTLAVQGVTAKTVYVCGWRSRAAGVATWFLENTASTNANCTSANTQITGVATEAANTGEVMNPAFWSGLKNTAGNGLCINTTGTGGVDIDIWYTQF